MTLRFLRIAYMFIGLLAAHSQAYARNFSCPVGMEGACLDYSEKVCPTSGKCVDYESVCFEPSQCDSKGFVCKSNLDELSAECDRAIQDRQNQGQQTDELFSILKRVESCVSNSKTLRDAHSCIPPHHSTQ